MISFEIRENCYSLLVSDDFKNTYNQLQNKYWKEYPPFNLAVDLVRKADIGEVVKVVFNADWKVEYEHKLRQPLVQSYGNGCEKLVLQDIRKVIDEHIPPMLFRMMPCEKYAMDYIIENLTGTISSITFNDPFDTMPMLNRDFMLKKIKEWWRIELSQMYEVWRDNSKLDKYYHCSDEGKREILKGINSIESEEYFIKKFNNEDFAIEDSL